MKCIVKDCENHKEQGGFVGVLCMPCHKFLTIGEGKYSQLYRNTVAAEREKVSKWMMQNGYATGHGDTLDDLLQELDWQIADGWNRALINGVETEREQCAKLLDEMAAEDKLSNYYQVAALLIRERGAP
jgi:hypothetical protein